MNPAFVIPAFIILAGLVLAFALILIFRTLKKGVRNNEPDQSKRSEQSAEDDLPEEFELYLQENQTQALRVQVASQPASLIHYSDAQSPEKMPRSKELVVSDKRPKLPVLAANQIVQAVPQIQTLLKAGKYVRIVGPPEALKGIEKGFFSMMPSQGGHLGAVVDANKQIVYQMRFKPASNLARVAGPMIVFQAASAVTLQYYLNHIDSQLSAIKASVNEVLQRLQSKTFGKMMGSMKTMEEVEVLVEASDGVDENLSGRLDNAEQNINEAYFECKKNTMNYVEDALSKTVEKTTPTENIERMQEAQARFKDDAYILFGAMHARTRWYKLDLVRATQGSHIDATRVELIRKAKDEMMEDRQRILDAIDALNIDAKQLKEIRDQKGQGWWPIKGRKERKALKEYNDFHKTFFEAFGGGSQESGSPKEGTPYLIELRQNENGEIESQTMMLETDIAPDEAGQKRESYLIR